MDKYLHVIQHKSEDMDRLIDDLFLFSKLDLNREIFNITKVNIHDFVEEVAKEIKLEWESDDTIIIENARKIIDTRNWVIHGYDKVDDVVIWGIVSNHLPKLKIEIEKLLDS